MTHSYLPYTDLQKRNHLYISCSWGNIVVMVSTGCMMMMKMMVVSYDRHSNSDHHSNDHRHLKNVANVIIVIILDGEGGAVSDDGRNIHLAALLRSFRIHGTTIHGTSSSSRLYEVQQMGPIWFGNHNFFRMIPTIRMWIPIQMLHWRMLAIYIFFHPM
jgi:hypothetical protein